MIYLELSDIVGTHNFGYGCLTKTNNNQFIASSGFDGTIQIRKANDLVIINLIHFNKISGRRLALKDQK